MKQTVSPTCPETLDLERFVAGQLLAPAAARIEQHLKDCRQCVETLGALRAQDSLLLALRHGPAFANPGESGVVEDLIGQLKDLPTVKETGGEEATLPPSPEGSAVPATTDVPVPLAPPQRPDELGRLGSYRILKVLGAGGMGVVFQAEDLHLQRLVALKAMNPALAASETGRQRFLLEARATAAIEHDHIVTIHQVGEDRGVPFFAMQFLKGESLDERLARVQRLPFADVVRIGREIAEGLSAAHERGLIHRDIKPANVWLEAGKDRVKILDFGLVRAAGGKANLTQPGTIMGTPEYMAPEQVRGEPADHRSDLFSLGCVLYRMSTGELPFTGADMVATLMAVATEEPQPPRERNAEIPPALAELILQLLAKEPSQRPASAQAVVQALQALADADASSPECATAAHPMKPASDPPRKHRRHWGLSLAAAVLLGALGVTGYYWGPVLVRVLTDQGEIAIQADDPEVAVLIDKGGVTIQDHKTGRDYRVRVGKQNVPSGDYTLTVSDPQAGLEFDTKEFTIKRGKDLAVKAWLKAVIRPFLISLKYANAQEVAGIIRDVYPDLGNLSVGVDDRGNKLILKCSERMYDDLKKLCDNLDAAAKDPRKAVRPITIKGIDPALVQQAVDAIQGRRATTTGKPGSGRTDAAPGLEDAATAFTVLLNADSDAYEAWIDRQSAAGFRPTALSVHARAGRPRFAAIAVKMHEPPEWWQIVNHKRAGYVKHWHELRTEQYRELTGTSYKIGDDIRYASLWVVDATRGRWSGSIDLTERDYLQRRNTLQAEGHRLLSVAVSREADGLRFQDNWIPDGATRWEEQHGLTAAQLEAVLTTSRAKHWRPDFLRAYEDRDGTRFLVILVENRANRAWEAKWDLSIADYERETTAQLERKLRPLSLTGYAAAGETRYAGLWIQYTPRASDAVLPWLTGGGKDKPEDAVTAFEVLLDKDLESYSAWINHLGKIAGWRPTALSVHTLAGRPRFAAIATRTAGSPGWWALYDLNEDTYQRRVNELQETYQETTSTSYQAGDATRYASLWIPQSVGTGWQSRRNLSEKDYLQLREKLADQGRRVVSVAVSREPEGLRFQANWDRDSAIPWCEQHGLTAAQLQAVLTEYRAKHWRPDFLRAYEDRDGPRFLVILVENVKNLAWDAKLDLSSADYERETAAQKRQKRRPLSVSGHAAQGASRYAGIWIEYTPHDGPPPVPAAADIRGPLKLALKQQENKVYALFTTCVPGVQRCRRFRVQPEQGGPAGEPPRQAGAPAGDRPRQSQPGPFRRPDEGVCAGTACARCCSGCNAPPAPGICSGLWLCRRGQANPRRADRALSHRQRQQADHGRRRAASRGAGQASSQRPSHGPLAGPAVPGGGRPRDPRLQDVTLLQLLHHTGGWDSDKSFDPMWRPFAIARALGVPPPARPGHIIRYMLGRRLDFDPGSRFAYSNFGYCLLGEVIQKVSGQSYEDYVRNEILLPLGIQRMRLGRSREQAPQEVRYYDEKNGTGSAVVGPIGKDVPIPYGTFHLEAMGAHGGWLASAIDLVRFAAALDDPRRCPILGPTQYAALFERPAELAGLDPEGTPKEVYYGCGWWVRLVDAARALGNTWHNGAMPGTSALLVRRHDGLNWAVLFNTRQGPSGQDLHGLIDPLLHRAADRVRTWPKYDLFAKLLSPGGK